MVGRGLGRLMNWKCTEIREGLRKLEFEEPPNSESGPRHVVVEFVRPEPLGPEETVRVPLGRQGSVLRELIGEPRLLDTRATGARGKSEYRYRLRGPVVEVHIGTA
jgi:hypothetical protein